MSNDLSADVLERVTVWRPPVLDAYPNNGDLETLALLLGRCRVLNAGPRRGVTARCVLRRGRTRRVPTRLVLRPGPNRDPPLPYTADDEILVCNHTRFRGAPQLFDDKGGTAELILERMVNEHYHVSS